MLTLDGQDSTAPEQWRTVGERMQPALATAMVSAPHTYETGNMNRGWTIIAIIVVAATLAMYAALSPPATRQEASDDVTPTTDDPPAAAATEIAEPSPAPAAATDPEPTAPAAEAPAQNPPEEAAPAAEQPKAPEPFVPDPPKRSGPVDELKQKFQSEPRESSAGVLEQRIESEFKKPHVPNGLFKSALCRTTVCRVQVRWSPERNIGYSLAFMSMMDVFELKVGIDPDQADKNGEVPIEVYLDRRAVPLKRKLAAAPTEPQ